MLTYEHEMFLLGINGEDVTTATAATNITRVVRVRVATAPIAAAIVEDGVPVLQVAKPAQTSETRVLRGASGGGADDVDFSVFSFDGVGVAGGVGEEGCGADRSTTGVERGSQ